MEIAGRKDKRRRHAEIEDERWKHKQVDPVNQPLNHGEELRIPERLQHMAVCHGHDEQPAPHIHMLFSHDRFLSSRLFLLSDPLLFRIRPASFSPRLSVFCLFTAFGLSTAPCSPRQKARARNAWARFC